MASFKLTVAVTVAFLFYLLVVVTARDVELSDEEVTLLLDKVLIDYPELLHIDASKLSNHLSERARLVHGVQSNERNKSKRKKNKERMSNYYEPLPVSGGRQHGRCDEVLVSTKGEQFRWIQGEGVNLTSGATTFFLHFSHSCDGCVDVIRKANEMYQGLRGRGLNIIGVFSNPVGYLPTTEEDRELFGILREHKISFPVVALGSKRGPPPLLRNGLIDIKRAKKMPTAPESLYRWLYGDLDFVVPIAVIYKNCLALQENPSVGYAIMALKGSVEKSRDDLLWPAGVVKDSQEQEERFQNTLLEFGIREDELGLALTEEEARSLDGEGEDDDEDSVEDEGFEQSKVRRRGRRAREGRRRSQDKDEDEDEDDDEL